MMTFYKGNQSGGIIGVLPGPPPNPPTGCTFFPPLPSPPNLELTDKQTTGGNQELCGGP